MRLSAIPEVFAARCGINTCHIRHPSALVCVLLGMSGHPGNRTWMQFAGGWRGASRGAARFAVQDAIEVYFVTPTPTQRAHPLTRCHLPRRSSLEEMPWFAKGEFEGMAGEDFTGVPAGEAGATWEAGPEATEKEKRGVGARPHHSHHARGCRRTKRRAGASYHTEALGPLCRR